MLYIYYLIHFNFKNMENVNLRSEINFIIKKISKELLFICDL
ncbi:hypothetical protein CCP3SC1AL1_680001 [Gammaproteobacteria bacterium]